jgi:predicted phosphoribosyltransferase
LGLNQDQIDEAIAKAKAKLSHANSLLSGLNAEIRLAGKDILIVDDVIATGLSVLGAVRHLERLNPLSISVASPVISRYASARLSKLNVEHFAVIVGEEDGFSPSNYYNDFKPISEQKAVEHMRNFHLRFS